MKFLASRPIRLIYAILFAILGINRIIYADNYLRFVPTFLPGRIFWVYLIGAFLITAAVSISLKKYTKTACIILSIFLILVVFTVHIPGLFYPNIMQSAMVSIIKDTGLAGGGIILAVVIGANEVE